MKYKLYQQKGRFTKQQYTFYHFSKVVTWEKTHQHISFCDMICRLSSMNGCVCVCVCVCVYTGVYMWVGRG